MDPDKALESLRDAVQELRDAETNDAEHDAAVAMAAAFEGLDGWLVGGHRLPTDWDALRSPVR